jgi:hypothetical protein
MAQKFHGIELAKNSAFANLVVETLANDPSPLVASRVWYNSTTNTFNYSDIDGNGAVRVNSFGSASSMNAAIATLTSTVTSTANTAAAATAAETARATAAEAGINTALATEVAARTAADATEAQARISGDALVAADAATAISTAASTASNADATETAARLAGDAAQTATSAAIQAELNVVEASLGLNADGTYTAPLNSTYLGTTVNQKEADIALDAAITAEVARATAADTASDAAMVAEVASRIAGDTNLQTQLTAYINAAVTNNANADAAEAARAIAAEAAISAIVSATDHAVGLAADGTFVAPTGTNYINGATTVLNAAVLLDAVAKTNADAIASEGAARTAADLTQTAALSAEVVSRTAAVAAVQAELDVTQAGAGLNTNGTYTASTDSNYINAAVTLKDADHVLDAAIKVVADRATAIESTSVPLLQSEITAEVTRATAAEAAEATRAVAAETALAASVAAETARAIAAEGVVTTSVATEVTRASGAENGLQSQINALVASAGAGSAALQASLNNKRYTYKSTSPALVHTVNHGLNTEFYSANIMVQGADGVWRNDIMPVQDVDANTYTITLTESSNVKASGQSNAAL